jgi:hypothetical protein
MGIVLYYTLPILFDYIMRNTIYFYCNVLYYTIDMSKKSQNFDTFLGHVEIIDISLYCITLAIQKKLKKKPSIKIHFGYCDDVGSCQPLYGFRSLTKWLDDSSCNA